MSRHTPLAVLLGCHLLVVAGALAFQLRLRADLLTHHIPPAARERLAELGWFVPAGAVVGTVVALGALGVRRGRARLRLAATGLVLAALPLVVVTLAVLDAVLAGGRLR